MATPFAINTGSTISGTTQIGDIAVGNTVQDYSSDPGGVQWYMGPEDSTGYVVARPDPSIGHTTPAGGNVGLSFRRSSDFTESSYINLANSVSLEAGGTGITSSSEATIWFGEQGVYSSFNDLRLYLDVVNTNSYPGTGVTWNDLSGYGNIGTLNGPPTFSNDSMVFGGTDYVNIGKNSSLLIGNDVTISSWVKISATGSYYGIYGGSNQNGSPRRGVTLGKWSDNKLCLFIGTNNSNYLEITANAAMVVDVIVKPVLTADLILTLIVSSCLFNILDVNSMSVSIE